MNQYRERIYTLARQIPKGRVMTYGQIAELLDSDEQTYTAQTVGWAMHALGDTDCWARVINSKGACSTEKVMLPGNKQQAILEQEGVIFDTHGRCDLQTFLWIPDAPISKTSTNQDVLITHPQFDEQQATLYREFNKLVEDHPQQLVQKYLRQYGPILSVRLACELSQNYQQSDLNRGYYRTAVTPGATVIIKTVLETILKSRSANKPVLIVAGGGPGSGKLTSINKPLLALKKQILCTYDASNETLNDLQSLINRLHSLELPTILAYILRPLPNAAHATIVRNQKERITPDASAFASAHQHNYQNFLSLTKSYTKPRTKRLFGQIVVFNSNGPDDVLATKSSFLSKTTVTIDHAIDIFFSVSNHTLAGTAEFTSYSPKTFPPKPSRPPRTAKTLISQTKLIGYLLAQSLRNSLIDQEKHPTTKAHHKSQNLEPKASNPGEPPTRTLTHKRNFTSKDQALQITNTEGQTLKGQATIIEHERPERIVVRETATHIQEMETVLVR